MMKRTPMKRTGWGNLPPTNKRRAESGPDLHIVPVNAAKFAIKPVVKSMAVMVKIGDLPHTAIQKENVLCSAAYEAAVRTLPCIRCGIVGFTQFCHADEGKGMGIKTDVRRGWPGCGPHDGEPGCHWIVGTSGILGKIVRRALEELYGMETRARIIAAGLWPKRLPLWTEP